jgi:hypothetical protein
MSATGISITKALYGAGSNTVDVTKTVASHISDGKINLVVTADSLGVNDPAPGQQNTLTVTYTINGGSSNTESIPDNGVFSLNAPSAIEATGLQIVKAEYGYTGNMTDVTDALQRYVKNGSIKVKVSSKAMGIPDPNPSKQKTLSVTYTLNGATNTQDINDGTTFSVSAPAVESPSTTTASQNTKTLMYTIWRSIGYFFFIALYTISIFTLADYGAPSPIVSAGTELSVASAKTAISDAFTTEAGRSRLLWMAMGVVFPYVAFWGLPTYVFWRRLFSPVDLI